LTHLIVNQCFFVDIYAHHFSRYIQINPSSNPLFSDCNPPISQLSSRTARSRILLQKPSQPMMPPIPIHPRFSYVNNSSSTQFIPTAFLLKPALSSQRNRIAHFPTCINWGTKHSVITISQCSSLQKGPNVHTSFPSQSRNIHRTEKQANKRSSHPHQLTLFHEKEYDKLTATTIAIRSLMSDPPLCNGMDFGLFHIGSKPMGLAGRERYPCRGMLGG
jgi:hypothetical protein